MPSGWPGSGTGLLRLLGCVAQDGESWNKAIKPKAVGAWNLHELSLGLKQLQHFVIFSSIVSSIGHQGERDFPPVRHSSLPAVEIRSAEGPKWLNLMSAWFSIARDGSRCFLRPIRCTPHDLRQSVPLTTSLASCQAADNVSMGVLSATEQDGGMSREGSLRAGQANYGYANSAVDTLAESRKLNGLPALAIQWGPIADVGFVAEVMKVGWIKMCSQPYHHSLQTGLLRPSDQSFSNILPECLTGLGLPPTQVGQLEAYSFKETEHDGAHKRSGACA